MMGPLCGEGVPPWFSALATPGQLGKPLHPVQSQPDGSCGANDTATWAEFAGDIDYNIKNRCCRKLNQGSWGQLAGSLAPAATPCTHCVQHSS